MFSRGGTNTYSTSETLTGKKWIDGKDIYRKVVSQDISTYSDNGTLRMFTLDHGISIDSIVSVSGHWVNKVATAGQGNKYAFGSALLNNQYTVGSAIGVTSSQISVRLNKDVLGTTKVTVNIVIEYTKT